MTTPLQQAAQAVIDRFESVRHTSTITPQVIDPQVGELRKALEAEQAQSVEPVAWIGDSPSKGNGRRLFWSESAAYAYADKYEPLYTRPAPPPAGEKKVGPVARVAGVDEYGPRIDWYAHWAELCGANLYATPPPAGDTDDLTIAYMAGVKAGRKQAQQVAVPMTMDEIVAAAESQHIDVYAASFIYGIRAAEAHHEIKPQGDKPQGDKP